jgi:signal transduction histidine kinase
MLPFMTGRSPEAIDTLVVFRVYAVLATIAVLLNVGLAMLFWGRGVPLAAAGTATMAMVGMTGMPYAAYAMAFTRVEDPAGRMRGLWAFAALHAGAGAFLTVLHRLATTALPAADLSATPLPYGAFAANMLVGALVLGYLASTAHPSARFSATMRSAGRGADERRHAFAVREKGGPASVRQLRSEYQEGIRQAARQEERARLARDLHDAVRQQLFVVQTAAATAQARFDADPAGARQAVEQVRAAARDALSEMDAMLDQLRAAPVENVGLVEALRSQAEALGLRTGAEVTLDIQPLPPPQALPPGAQEALYRVAQEALANIGRHARAAHVTVRLARRGRALVLDVADDGSGFDVRTGRRGMGLSNMQARAAEVGGRFELTTSPGAGTTVALGVPLVARGARDYLLRGGLFGATLLGLLAARTWVGADLRPWWISAVWIAAIGVVRYGVAFARVRHHSPHP